MIENIIFPKYRDILVIGAPRSGTTALCNYISKKTGFKNLNEIFSVKRKKDRPKSLSDPNQRYVLKLLPEQYTERKTYRSEIEQKLSDSFIIILERKDLRAHIISLYVSTITDRWHFLNERDTDEAIKFSHSDIRIDLDVMHWCLTRVKVNKKWLNEFKKFVHIPVIYEEMGILDSDWQVFPRPKNHQELFEILDNNFGSQLT